MVLRRRLFPMFFAALLPALSSERVEADGLSVALDAGAPFDIVNDVYPTADGGYLVASEYRHLTKLSAAGDVIWSQEMMYGHTGMLSGYRDGFFALGYKTIIRLNALGDVVWWRSLVPSPTLARAFLDGTVLISASPEETGNRPFIAKLGHEGQVLWRMSVDLPVLSSSDVGWVTDLLPLADGGFLAAMVSSNFQPDENNRTESYVVRFSANRTVVWARAGGGGFKLGETANGYFSYGYGTLVKLDRTGNIERFRSGLPVSVSGIQPTADDGFLIVGGDPQILNYGSFVQKLDWQLNSQWMYSFPSDNPVFLNSIAPTASGDWVLGGQVVLPGPSDYDGWIFHLAPNGEPYGGCPASELADSNLGNGRRQCEVLLTYPSPQPPPPAPPIPPVVTVVNCDPGAPPGYRPVQQDFDFTCKQGAQPDAVTCTVETRNNFGTTFSIVRDGMGSEPLEVGPNESGTVDLTYWAPIPPGTYFIRAITPPVGRGDYYVPSAPPTVLPRPGQLLLSLPPGDKPWKDFSISSTVLCTAAAEICPQSVLANQPELDTDKDSLPDCLEKNGFRDPQTGRMLVNLPALGARPNHADVLVEIDYLVGVDHEHDPHPNAINLAKKAFANLPYLNPDGKAGINLIVDFDPSEPGSESNSFDGYDPWTQGTYIPFPPYLDQPTLNELKSKPLKSGRLGFSNYRRGIYHYCVFGHGSDLEGSLGWSPWNPYFGSADCVVSLGSTRTEVGTINEQAGTFLHELGHNLGLDHGGHDDFNFKPNYRSVMNYSFATSDLLSFSTDQLPTLYEKGLNEFEGIGVQEGTLYRCPLLAPDQSIPPLCDYFRPVPATQSNPAELWCGVNDGSRVDWNCNGGLDCFTVANISGGKEQEILFSYGDQDWIKFTGIRQPAPASSVDSPLPGELTAERDSQIPKPRKLVVEAVSPTVVSLTSGETQQAAFRVLNLGMQDDTYDLFVYSTAGHALDGIPGPLTPAPIALAGGQSALVQVAVTAPPAGAPDVSDLVLVVAGRRRPDLPEEASVRIAVGSVEPLDFYTLLPCRLADTRPASVLESDLVRAIPVGALCGVPLSARAVAVNVTVAQPSGPGFLTLFPAGHPTPPTITLNFEPGQVRANSAILALGKDAMLAAVSSVAGNGSVHLIIDVAGYFE